jgi:DNA-binding transcriptional MocR family regulator
MSRPPYLRLHIRCETPGRVHANDIVASVVREHERGALPAGARMAPVRVLEHQLGVSKNTVQAAYDELAARGILAARSREGVFVADRREPLSVAAPLTATPPTLRSVECGLPERFTEADVHLSSVFVDPALLPHERVADCFRSVLGNPRRHALYDVQGYGPLRELIAQRLRLRGMNVETDDIIVTCGSQQALDIAARVIEPRAIATENPVYSLARGLFEMQGLRTVALPLDPFGPLDVEEWRRRLMAEPPGLLYAITSFQNPTGRSYSTTELETILRMSREIGFALLEDDWGSDMLSEADYRPTLRALGGEHVLYVNSFTKKLMPSLRIGFIAAHKSVAPTLLGAKRLAAVGGPTVVEAALCELLDRGYYDTHLARLQTELDLRYHACLESLRELMPEGVRWTLPGGGPILWLDVPRSVDLDQLAARLAEEGVRIQPRPRAFYGTPHLHGFPVGYAFTSPLRLRGALEALARELSRA